MTVVSGSTHWLEFVFAVLELQMFLIIYKDWKQSDRFILGFFYLTAWIPFLSIGIKGERNIFNVKDLSIGKTDIIT